MGVLNLTPDSFSDGGKYNKKGKGYDYAVKLFKSGSNIIDVGGESTRPMSKEIKINNKVVIHEYNSYRKEVIYTLNGNLKFEENFFTKIFFSIN